MRNGPLFPSLARIALPVLFWLAAICHGSTAASSLDGKTYIIQMSSSQASSGYASYLVPPLAKALNKAGLKSKGGPGADLAINIVTNSDVGQWMTTTSGKEWLYTVKITVGISPEDYEIPYEGTPQFGAEVTLLTPNGDREDELVCLIDLATKNAIAHYKPTGLHKSSGQACLRKQ
ncbi:hypothetical protein JJB09_01105 [Rhizobium sp. KVB221]|uniref:Uncharacterized protein n=1 Tax=Rhizobium setariae TaxID=2801340 RepID=A0A937CN11_9HYPH|nr:hypothetical protein [Rhizobium setariae]MBL0370613.1 hypothetical protein [Rhizobium setariae]